MLDDLRLDEESLRSPNRTRLKELAPLHDRTLEADLHLPGGIEMSHPLILDML